MNNSKMESKLLPMCNECKAIKISEEPERWIRYNFFTKNLYNKFSKECKGLSYCSCPKCAGKIRRFNRL
jgi:hypothetical protein